MGFKVIRKDDFSPNAWICASVRSDIIIWERLLEQQNSYHHFTEQNLFKKVSKNIGLFSDEII